MDCIVHGVTKSRTRLSNFRFHANPLPLRPRRRPVRFIILLLRAPETSVPRGAPNLLASHPAAPACQVCLGPGLGTGPL